jgi:heavy metal translocating P-type ATPase
MKFVIKHEIKGRIRVHLMQGKMTYEQADTLEYYLSNSDGVRRVKVYDVTGDVVLEYTVDREDILLLIKTMEYNKISLPKAALENSGRELNAYYKDLMITKITMRCLRKLFIPIYIRKIVTVIKAIPRIYRGIQCISQVKIEVPLLDAIAIGVSIARKDFKTASSIMFLLGIGETLEEWTHKKSVGDLARSMSLNIGNVWALQNDKKVLVPYDTVKENDIVVVNIGNIVPFDGEVIDGDAMVNQASLTGEGVPVHKMKNSYVYAGTVLEEGELTIRICKSGGKGRYDTIISMIENTEKMKSKAESKAEHLADKLVPYSLAGTVLTWLITRNTTKALSVLMVDFSCALKLAMPITVLSAIREAGEHNITVKGGKFLEVMAEADTIVFDKTGTLTKSKPSLREVISYTDDYSEDELLRIAACLEEHFPHSMANAVVEGANIKGLEHDEMHSKVDYVVAHGIVSHIDGKRVLIGSHHFVVEDEKCSVSSEYRPKYDKRPLDCSHLYMAIDGIIIAVLCIEDPLREEAAYVISQLHESGFEKIVMMTGDSRRTAEVIAKKIGVDEWHAEVLPDEKASYVMDQKRNGRKVIMVGDGINDSPALSSADIGIAISDGAAIAREIADITITADNLQELVKLRTISVKMMQKIKKNYREIVGINSSLIGLGVLGVITPTTSSLIHNASTVAIGVSGLRNVD